MITKFYQHIYGIFSGRTGCGAYASSCILYAILFGVFFYILLLMDFSHQYFNPYISLFILGLFLLFYAVSTIRRLHDMNAPGGLVFISLGLLVPSIIVPLVAFITESPMPPRLSLDLTALCLLLLAIFSLVLFISPGTDGPNKYGPENNTNAVKARPLKKEKWLYALLPVFIAALLLAPYLMLSGHEKKPNAFKLAQIICGTTTKEDILALETGTIIEDEPYRLIYYTDIHAIPCEAWYIFSDLRNVEGKEVHILGRAKFILQTRDEIDARLIMDQLIDTYGNSSSGGQEANTAGHHFWSAGRSKPFHIDVEVPKDYKNMTIIFSNQK